MMSPHEFRERVFARAVTMLIGTDLSMKEARKRAIAELAAAGRIELKKRPRRAASSVPQPPPSDDLRGELATAKDRLFAKLSDYFRRHDANVARELAAKKAAKRAERAARKAARAGTSSPNNVVPLRQPDASQPDVLPPESTHPTAYLVYAGGPSGAVRVEDPLPSVATFNNRASIAHNEAMKLKRGEQ